MKNNIVLFLVSSFLFISCIKKVDDFEGNYEEKVMVTSFISPFDSVIIARVQLTVPAYNNDISFEIIENATITISDGTTSEELVYNPVLMHYELSQEDFKIKSSTSYKLEVKANDEVLTAECFVPDDFKINPSSNHTVEIFEEDNSGIFAAVNYNYSWNGSSGYFFPYSRLDYDWYVYKDGVSDTKEPFLTVEKRNYIDFNYPVMIPNFKVEGENKSLVGFPVNSFSNNDSIVYLFKNVKFYVLKSDIHYVKYYKSINAQSSTNGSLSEEGNPFTEPKILYSNIKNGIGVFGSYVVDSLSIDINQKVTYRIDSL